MICASTFHFCNPEIAKNIQKHFPWAKVFQLRFKYSNIILLGKIPWQDKNHSYKKQFGN